MVRVTLSISLLSVSVDVLKNCAMPHGLAKFVGTPLASSSVEQSGISAVVVAVEAAVASAVGNLFGLPLFLPLPLLLLEEGRPRLLLCLDCSCRSWKRRIISGQCKLSAGSQVLSSWLYPFHLIKKNLPIDYNSTHNKEGIINSDVFK